MGRNFLFPAAGARRAIESNLDHVCGPPSGPPGALAVELDRHQRSFRLFCNYAQMLSDTYGMHMGLPLDSDTGTVGYEHIVAAVRRGKGVIAATGHLECGSLRRIWPAARARASRRDGRGAKPRGAGVRKRFRDRFEIVYTTGSPFASLRLAQVLREGRCWACRSIATSVARSGRSRFRPAGALSHRPRAPCPHHRVPASCPTSLSSKKKRAGGAWCTTSSQRSTSPTPAIARGDIQQTTAAVVAVYERFVRRYPTQWYHFYDFFSPRLIRGGSPPRRAEPPREPTSCGHRPGGGLGFGLGAEVLWQDFWLDRVRSVHGDNGEPGALLGCRYRWYRSPGGTSGAAVAGLRSSGTRRHELRR